MPDFESIWRSEYERNRYLRNAPDEFLDQRLKGISANLWSTDKDGNVTQPRRSDVRHELLKLAHHVILEKLSRGLPTPSTFEEKALRDAGVGSYVPPKLASPFMGGPSGFAKYGKRDHIKASFERGTFRIAAASSYLDPSLNPAQADHELEHTVVTPNEHLLMRLYGKDAAGNEVEIPHTPLQLFRYMQVPNFYVWCCGLSYDARMFYDFEAEALLMIRDMEAFTARFIAAVKATKPDLASRHGPCAYYDPYTVTREQLTPMYSKNLRYLYQNEYRFTWTAPPETTDLPTFFVELGPLADIAEFYELA
ncbi:hypothetical protein [Jiella marina]|uniref:hypothetical protein n=1 Tax=Jiella sp. LLJ827 TaxID=2917712 RepID=UPI002100BE17|nr:hypothetical protein [Jiella sp. LLJ827]MCQ0987228.1 hypothetical protein [Jiella sp. LLJ827]